jgi:hypothetical protein
VTILGRNYKGKTLLFGNKLTGAMTLLLDGQSLSTVFIDVF